MLVRWAGNYEFQACTHGGWAVYLNDHDADPEFSVRHLGTWDTLKEAHAAVGAPAFDED